MSEEHFCDVFVDPVNKGWILEEFCKPEFESILDFFYQSIIFFELIIRILTSSSIWWNQKNIKKYFFDLMKSNSY